MVQLGLDLDALQAICRRVQFDSGSVIRRRGVHYSEMYLILEGTVEIDRGLSEAPVLLLSGPGIPIGEIGFLQGTRATATVTAKTPISALVFDNAAAAELERHPETTARFLRQLALIADERLSQNLVQDSSVPQRSSASAVEIFLCRNQEMLEAAQRLRYTVYCLEFDHQSPNADHVRKLIADELDSNGHLFVAVDQGEVIGTIRVNVSSEGSLGYLDELYGMRNSKHHPQATGICTKFIVQKSRRGGRTALKLISAAVRFALERSLKECYIDCIPGLLSFYQSMGFEQSAAAFVRPENGLCYPMMLDLEKYGPRLSRERNS